MKNKVLFAFSFILLVIVSGCSDDTGTGIQLVPPTVASITPNRVSRAEKVTGTITGTSFTGTSQVYLGDGVTVENFTVLNPSTIEVRFLVNTNATAGQRPVQVTTAGGTATAPNLLEVLDNRVPLAFIQYDPQNGAANTNFTFDALRTDDTDGNVVRYEWEFGDGKKATGPIVTHKYNAVGTFQVTLFAYDNDDGKGTTTISLDVRAGTAPQAKFFINPDSGDINTTYTFNASNSTDTDGTIREYFWEFGGGKTASGPIVDYLFGDSGTFSVTLTVTDNDGLQNAVRKDVIVRDFDEDKAADEIRAVILEFYRLYSQLDTLTAERIVVGWSDSAGCPGRAHEINIINNQKVYITKTQATASGPIDVSFNSSTRAHAISAADFAWTETDGNSYTGFATHDFEFIFENGEWLICNFTLI